MAIREMIYEKEGAKQAQTHRHFSWTIEITISDLGIQLDLSNYTPVHMHTQTHKDVHTHTHTDQH